jgi:hypothetical protein
VSIAGRLDRRPGTEEDTMTRTTTYEAFATSRVAETVLPFLDGGRRP